MLIELAPERLLVVTAHPDDAEFFVGGTMARLAAAGTEVHLAVLTDGQGGAMERALDRPTVAAIRRREQGEAARILGVRRVHFFGEEDGRLFDCWPLRVEVARRIREIRPEVLVTIDPREIFLGNHLQHPDHRAAGEIALAAAMPVANVRHAAPDLDDLEPHTISQVLLIMSRHSNVTVALDAGHVEAKIAALRAHASQMAHWNPEPMVRARAAEAGREAGVPFGESFLHLRMH